MMRGCRIKRECRTRESLHLANSLEKSVSVAGTEEAPHRNDKAGNKRGSEDIALIHPRWTDFANTRDQDCGLKISTGVGQQC